MIDLYLSTDGKHTVHVAAETAEELAKLAPQAKALYDSIVSSYGNKAQMWQDVVSRKQVERARFGKRIDTPEEAEKAVAPRCPIHDRPMVLRRGRLGPFWSCAYRKINGEWCNATYDISEAQGEDTVVEATV